MPVIGARAAAKGLEVRSPAEPEERLVWRPLLDGELAIRARQVAHEIALALADHAPADIAGAADAAVFWAHAADVFEEAWAERAHDRAIEHLGRVIGRGTPSLGLFGGLTGAGWAAHYISGAGGDAESDESDLPPLVDRLLVDVLSRPQWSGHYDLISGLVGFGVYFLARRGRPMADRGLELGLARLEAFAHPVGAGLGWKTPAALLPAHQRRVHPEGTFDLGLAHGVAGVIGLYAAVLSADALPGDAAKLRRSLVSAVAFVEANRRPERVNSVFDWCADAIGPEGAARTAWCYGDLGISIVLLRAAQALGDEALRRRAVAMGRACAMRADDKCGVEDAGLCHGAAGLGHLLNRLFQATGDPVLGEGARRWFRRTLERRTTEDLAGFPAFAPALGPNEPPTWHPDPGILGGAAGVGLALLSALGASPGWDQPFLTDLPCCT